MNFEIKKERLNNFMMNHFDKNYIPDYGWGTDLHSFYKKEIENFGGVNFYINDRLEYTYAEKKIERHNIEPKTLIVHDNLSSELNLTFGNAWVKPFIEWFEKNTGLKVENFKSYKSED